MSEQVVRDHLQAAATHEAAADEHDRLAAHWHEHGDTERAASELQIALHQRHLALLERDRAVLEDARASNA